MTRVKRWLGLSQSLPEGGEDDEANGDEIDGGVEGRGTVQIGHTRPTCPLVLLPWKRARFCGVGAGSAQCGPVTGINGGMELG